MNNFLQKITDKMKMRYDWVFDKEPVIKELEDGSVQFEELNISFCAKTQTVELKNISEFQIYSEEWASKDLPRQFIEIIISRRLNSFK